MLLFAISFGQIVGRFEQSYIQYYAIDTKGSIGHCLKRHCLKHKLIIHDHTIIPKIY